MGIKLLTDTVISEDTYLQSGGSVRAADIATFNPYKNLPGATMGYFGDVIKFEIKSDKLLTFRNMRRDVAGRWVQHKVSRQEPHSEHIGPDQLSMSLDVTIRRDHGYDVTGMIWKIEDAIRWGRVEYLIIGGLVYGYNKWYIESASETWDTFLRNGTLIKASMTLNFKHYY